MSLEVARECAKVLGIEGDPPSAVQIRVGGRVPFCVLIHIYSDKRTDIKVSSQSSHTSAIKRY